MHLRAIRDRARCTHLLPIRLPALPAFAALQTQQLQLLQCVLAETGVSLDSGLAALDQADNDDAVVAAQAALLHTSQRMAQAKQLLQQLLLRTCARRHQLEQQLLHATAQCRQLQAAPTASVASSAGAELHDTSCSSGSADAVM